MKLVIRLSGPAKQILGKGKLLDLFCQQRGNIRIEELGRRNETDKV